MKWLGVTVALLAASAFLVAWIYMRDRHVTNWLESDAARAHQDARTVLSALEGYHCHKGCDYRVVDHSSGSHWLARIDVPWSTRCFEIDVNTFAFSPEHGLSGIEQVKCPADARDPVS